MNILKFEREMRARGASLVGTTMYHDTDKYKILGVLHDSEKIRLLFEGRTISINMNSWKVVQVSCRIPTGFSWRIL